MSEVLLWEAAGETALQTPCVSESDQDPDAGRRADFDRPSDQRRLLARQRSGGSLPVRTFAPRRAGFAQVIALFAQLPFKAVAVIVVWALAHHLLDGVRHLLTDFDVGSRLRVARAAPGSSISPASPWRCSPPGRCGDRPAECEIRFTGLRAWWVQRVSAVYMLLFFVVRALVVRRPSDARAIRSGRPGSLARGVTLALLASSRHAARRTCGSACATCCSTTRGRRAFAIGCSSLSPSPCSASASGWLWILVRLQR